MNRARPREMAERAAGSNTVASFAGRARCKTGDRARRWPGLGVRLDALDVLSGLKLPSISCVSMCQAAAFY